MEFDIEKNKVVGIADIPINDEHLRIKVYGYFDNSLNYKEFDSISLKRIFSPDGYVFEPNFFNNPKFSSINLGDLIEFKAYRITNAKEGFNEYRINNTSPVKRIGYKIVEFKNMIIENNVIQLNGISVEDDDLGDFYAEYENNVIGKLRKQKGEIIPFKYKRLYQWPIDKCNIIYHNTDKVLVTENKEKGQILDAMSNDQLFNWFREKLKELNETFINELDKNTKWRTRIPEILDQNDSDLFNLQNIRIQRLNNTFNYYELSKSEIKDLIKSSQAFRELFSKSINLHKNEFKLEYKEELEELKKRNELEQEKLERLLSKISIEIALKKNELNSVLENINTAQSQIENLNNNKERILADFSIIKEVLGGSIAQTEQVQSNSFVIETFQSQNEGSLINNKEWFIARLKHILAGGKISTSISSILIDIIATYKGAFISNEQIALAFIEATGNCKFIIQQVEPDWLHFKDLWNNGLGAIWKSSHENPNVLHFLVLEDINLSSPECYMRPLLDCMNGIRKRIPFAMNEFPKNLRILATKISSDEPKIGLPLLEQTFKNWGAVGFVEPIHVLSGQKYSIVDGYIDSTTLSKFKLDDFDIETDALALSSQFKKIFDRPE